MLEGYREDINQNVPARRGRTRWWPIEEYAEIVPGGKKTFRALRMMLGIIWSWVWPVVQVLPGPDWLAYAVFVLVKVYFLPLVACALLVFFVWLTKKLWRAWQQRF